MKLIFLSFLLLASQILNAQDLGKKIERAFSNFEKDEQLQYGLASLTVLNAETGEVVYSKNGNTALAPASTLKTITAITGFNLLKPDYKWETVLGYSGSVVSGVLKGNLILKGSGDPTLGSSRYEGTQAKLLLNKWVEAAKKAGISKIEGDIIAEDLSFGTQTIPAGWIWGDIGNYYGAGATSLSWMENEASLTIVPGGKMGEPVTIKGLNPRIEGLRLVNEAKTGKPGSGDNVYAFSAPYTDIVYVRGTYGIDLQKKIKISMPDPALTLALQLRSKLNDSGITVSGDATTARKLSLDKNYTAPSFFVIDRHFSPELSKVVYWLNQKSLNLYAENLLKTLAIHSGKPGSFENGVNVLNTFWNKNLNIDTNSISILDGSGLSPENRVTTTTMAKILLSARSVNWFPDFYASLPLYNNMKMKSGSIRNVLCYTGYEKSASGTSLVFSFMTNNYNGSTSAIRQKMFRVLDVLK